MMNPVSDSKRATLRRVVAVVLVCHVALLVYSSWLHSPNHLESNLLPAAWLHLHYGRFDIAQVNPPLSRMLCGLPMLGFPIAEDWAGLIEAPGSRPEYGVGRDFLKNNADSLRVMLFACRAIAIGFSVLGALSVLACATRFYGPRAGTAALIVWYFCPMVLGHGSTINHDVPGAALLAAAFLWFLRWHEDPSGAATIAFGLAAGAAVATRTSSIPIILLWLVFDCLMAIRSPVRIWLRRVCFAAAVPLIGVLVVNSCYGFSGTLKPLGRFVFCSQALAGSSNELRDGNVFKDSIFSGLPVPLPSDFVVGLDLQQRDFESPSFPSYLFGEWRDRGWAHYFLVGWAVKTPIGFQAAFLLSLGALMRRAWRQQMQSCECLVVVTIAFVFGLVSYKSGFTIHYRYVFPAFPFIAIATSGLWADAGRKTILAGTLLIGYGVVSSLAVFPHSLSYFNEFAGGPRNGGRFLLHSSCDWGQDLFQTAEWLNGYRGDREALHVECWGPVDSRVLGVDGKRIPRRQTPASGRGRDEEEIVPGVYVISVSALYDRSGAYRYLDQCQPRDHIGFSIKVFELTEREIDAHRLNDCAPGKDTVSER